MEKMTNAAKLEKLVDLMVGQLEYNPVPMRSIIRLADAVDHYILIRSRKEFNNIIYHFTFSDKSESEYCENDEGE